MVPPSKIAVIHATQVSISTVTRAFAQNWSDAKVVNILDEGLSLDRSRKGNLTKNLRDRIIRLAAYAHDCGAEAILFACSAFGSAIDEAARQLPIPVLKPNDAMFRAALAHGDDLVLLVTFEPAGPAMTEEFHELVAKSHQTTARLKSVYVPGALDALQKEDATTHDNLIAAAAADHSDVSAIMLGQFSMSSAAQACAATTDTPVFTSPDSAIELLRGTLSKK